LLITRERFAYLPANAEKAPRCLRGASQLLGAKITIPVLIIGTVQKANTQRLKKGTVL
jgi:hypothetical protein